jgi:membrane-associated phospholipid phosphatase
MRPARAPLTLAALVLVLLLLDYALSFGISSITTVDQRAIPQGLAGAGVAQAKVATARLLDTISVASLVIAGLGLVAIALARRRYRQAAAALAVVAGANVTTQLLKPALGGLDPLGGDAERFSQGIFPSGHATVAMSLALALVIVVPAAARPLAAVVGVVYTGAVGVGLLLLGWHFPSDVVGGFLVAALWAAAAVAWLRRAGQPEAVTMTSLPRLRTGMAIALAVAGLVALTAAVAIGVRITDLEQAAELGRLRTAFIGGSVVIVLLALALPPAIAALLLERSASGSRASAGTG